MITPQELFQLLSDETRLRCLALLHKKKEICVCEFTCILKTIQPKISRHLGHLRKSGLVLDERKGQWVYYRLNPKVERWKQRMLATIMEDLHKLEPYRTDKTKLSKQLTSCSKA